jgi:hypothetical protein
MRHNQNRRSRSRSRKGPNPLTRSFESNGPDVKVRGTASHIADKYMSLARDAQSSGDFVAAENYLQHAEHYNRIVMAAQAQFQQSQQAQYREGPDEGYDDDRQMNGTFRDRYNYNGGGRPGDEEGDERYEAGTDEEDHGFGPQPQVPRPPRQDDRDRSRRDRYEYRGHSERADRGERSERSEQGDRYERSDRNAPQDRNYRSERSDAAQRSDYPPRSEAPEEPVREESAAEPAAPAPESGSGNSRRRRTSRAARPENGPQPDAESQEMTRDGEAALVAFPD